MKSLSLPASDPEPPSRPPGRSLVKLLAGLGLAYFAWVWLVERHDAGPGEFFVRVKLWGDDLPDDDMIAPDPSYKGVQLDVLAEGRHFASPFAWKLERHRAIDVPAGKCLILSRKFGTAIPPERVASGDVLARDGERGILEEVRRPGTHRVNPHAYESRVVDATEVKAEQVGVRVLKIGKDPLTLGQGQSEYVVPEGFRGVQERAVSPGTYYVNPFVEQIIPVDLRSHRVEFADISFPSRDGFRLRPHVLVTYRVSVAKAPELFVQLSDADKLPQADSTPEEQAANPILQKVVLPLIRGYVRIEGSKYAAGDFVNQAAADLSAPPKALDARNARERLQEEMIRKVRAPCEEVGIVVESITLTQFEDDKDLSAFSSIIAERELARLSRERNAERIDQYTKDAETKAAEAKVEQKSLTVAAKTKLEVEQTNAKQRLEVEESKLKQDLANAQVKLDAAQDQAKATVSLGRNEAEVIEASNKAEVAGLKTKIDAFAGPALFAQQQLLLKVGPALKEIFASDSGEFAKLFSRYLAPPEQGFTREGPEQARR